MKKEKKVGEGKGRKGEGEREKRKDQGTFRSCAESFSSFLPESECVRVSGVWEEEEETFFWPRYTCISSLSVLVVSTMERFRINAGKETRYNLWSKDVWICEGLD